MSTPGLTGPGSLTVPASVVAKIASQAAAELPQAGAASGGVLGIGARRDFNQRPTADAQLFGNTAVVEIELGLVYPAPLRANAETVRQHVIDRVHQLTGFDVEQVDLNISWLHPATTATKGGLR